MARNTEEGNERVWTRQGTSWSEDLVQTEWRVGQKNDIAMHACETMKREINVFIGNW